MKVSQDDFFSISKEENNVITRVYEEAEARPTQSINLTTTQNKIKHEKINLPKRDKVTLSLSLSASPLKEDFVIETHKKNDDNNDHLMLVEKPGDVPGYTYTDKELHAMLVNQYDDIYSASNDSSSARKFEDKVTKHDTAWFLNTLGTRFSSNIKLDSDKHIVPLGLSKSYAICLSTKSKKNQEDAELHQTKMFMDAIKEQISVAESIGVLELIVKEFEKTIGPPNSDNEHLITEIEVLTEKKLKEFQKTQPIEDDTDLLKNKQIETTQRLCPSMDIVKVVTTTKHCQSVKHTTLKIPESFQKNINDARKSRLKNQKVKARKKKEKFLDKVEERVTESEGTLLFASLLHYKDKPITWKNCLDGKISSTNEFYVADTELAASTENGVAVHKIPRGTKIEQYNIDGLPSDVFITSVFMDKDYVACILSGDGKFKISCQTLIFDRRNNVAWMFLLKDGPRITAITREPLYEAFWFALSNGGVYCVSLKTQNLNLSTRSVVIIAHKLPIIKLYRRGRCLHCQTVVNIAAIAVIPLQGESLDQMVQREGMPRMKRFNTISAFDRYGLMSVVLIKEHDLFIEHRAFPRISKVLTPSKNLVTTIHRKEKGPIRVYKSTCFPLTQHIRFTNNLITVLYSNGELRFTWATDKLAESENIKKI